MKTQASNAEKVLIKGVIVKLTLEVKIVNEKTPQDLDSFIIPQRQTFQLSRYLVGCHGVPY